MKRPATIPAILLPLALAVLAHLPALWSGLVWDDPIIVRDQLPYFHGLRDAFLPPAGVPNFAADYYRPLVVLSFLADFRWLGDATSTVGPHLVNLLLHLAVTAAVWRLARRALAPSGVAPVLAATALFAAYPLHVESVNWISGRTDVMATLGTLMAVLAALEWRDHGRRRWLALLAIALYLGLLAKEVALAACVLVPVACRWLPQADGRAPRQLRFADWCACGAALLAAVAGWLTLRHLAGVAAGAPPAGIGPVIAAIALLRAGAWYALELSWPWPLHHLVTWDDLPHPWVALGVLAGAATAGFIAWRQWRLSGDGLPLVALGWCAGALAPSLWIALNFATPAPVAERYLYLPSIGVALAVGWIFARIRPAWRRAAGGALAAIVAAAMASAYARGLDWVSDVALWRAATAQAPTSTYAWGSLARAYRAAGNDSEALATYQAALDRGTDADQRAKVLYGMAEIALARRDWAEAERLLGRSAAEAPAFQRPVLGLALVTLGREGNGISVSASAARRTSAGQLRATLALAPHFHELRLALAQLQIAEGDARSAAGEAGPAAQCQRNALATLAALDAALPAAALAALLRDAETGLARDSGALRARAVAGLRDAAAAGPDEAQCPV